jgi:hypothetical protein
MRVVLFNPPLIEGKEGGFDEVGNGCGLVGGKTVVSVF